MVNNLWKQQIAEIWIEHNGDECFDIGSITGRNGFNRNMLFNRKCLAICRIKMVPVWRIWHMIVRGTIVAPFYNAKFGGTWATSIEIEICRVLREFGLISGKTLGAATAIFWYGQATHPCPFINDENFGKWNLWYTEMIDKCRSSRFSLETQNV